MKINEIERNIENYHQELTEKEIKEFVNERFLEVKKNQKIKELVSFQAMNKYLIMAHDQQQLQVLRALDVLLQSMEQIVIHCTHCTLNPTN